jgi:hypothetical protein
MKWFFQKKSITRRSNYRKFVLIFGFKCVAKDIEGQLQVFLLS